MRTPTKKRKTPIKETKSVSVSTTSTPVKTSPKARRSLKLSDVEAVSYTHLTLPTICSV